MTSINQVTEESRRAQFLIPVDADGKNQARASLERAQFLNPMVEVKADTDPVESKPDDFFFQFDAVKEPESIDLTYLKHTKDRQTDNLLLYSKLQFDYWSSNKYLRDKKALQIK